MFTAPSNKGFLYRGLLSLECGLSEFKEIQQSLNLPHFTYRVSEVQKGAGIDLRSLGGVEEELILESRLAGVSLLFLWTTLLLRWPDSGHGSFSITIIKGVLFK